MYQVLPTHQLFSDIFKKIIFVLTVFTAIVITENSVYALAAPAAGSFLYDIYDIVVNKMVKGAPGFAAGVFAMVLAGYSFIQAKVFPAVAAGVGAALMFTGDKIVTSLGALVF